ncbi:hypothetical protein [Aureibacter tunicatorum]|uniref:Uncharacterized protein n=1 Tax=Aureibacter tunicatorum TaxID=866807 RepID=A0AAE4BVP8_9BACT|nr:hypothetical protein [Aureibacter tunicatorum]MDR6241903.1 hypothetical protein [Aureibacter tunicatorum]BDD07452.1 hypothetical protein AUTU_49350 [Aureibacter tunicatorum]
MFSINNNREKGIKKGRNAELVERRNKALIKRFYYWTELKRRRFDDTLQILSSDEFYISEQTIENILRKNVTYLEVILEKKPSLNQLKKY